MNYRHGFHAGNHTEPFKHAVLCVILDLLSKKDTPYVVIDTHAGAGVHDLGCDMALRTREARDGICRLMSCREPALARYLGIVHEVGGSGPSTYPGSPEIARRAMRATDRLVACERHPRDAAALRVSMADDPRVGVHLRDGYEAGLALIPPRERRGLVFTDPPFEDTQEAGTLGEFMVRACAKWPTGTYCAWYPIKTESVALTIRAAALRSGARGVLSASFTRYPRDGKTLSGGGVVVLNPPWTTDARVAGVCRALRTGYGVGEWAVEPLRVA